MYNFYSSTDLPLQAKAHNNFYTMRSNKIQTKFIFFYI